MSASARWRSRIPIPWSLSGHWRFSRRLALADRHAILFRTALLVLTVAAGRCLPELGEQAGFHGQAGAKGHGTNALVPGVPILEGLFKNVLEDEEHSGAAHVAVMAQDVPCGDQLGVAEAQPGL